MTTPLKIRILLADDHTVVRRGLRMVEVPGAYIRRGDKASTVRGVRDSLRYFTQLVRFRSRLRREGR